MDIVGLLALWIGAEGAKTRSKMQKTHFLLRWLFQGRLFNVLRDKRSVGDPTGASAEEAPRPPVESEAPGAEM
ncbi:hypothetical protein AM500_02890 [Bacillus sp. FJAT-18017]|nr:hypothetical protein AM500_02890 [Bacillus sp. FJAT-18017]